MSKEFQNAGVRPAKQISYAATWMLISLTAETETIQCREKKYHRLASLGCNGTAFHHAGRLRGAYRGSRVPC
jgi:hypothetical protein